jgi:serine phosphatase RsbU (regulator of sigma subunit)
MMSNRVLGVFDIQSQSQDAFTPEDVTLVQALADTVAIGLRNAGMFATETRRRILAETLREVSTVLVSSLTDLERVLDGLLSSLERVVEYEAALILLRREEDSGESTYVVRAARGVINEGEVLGQCIAENEDGKTVVINRMWELLRSMEQPEPATERLGRDRLYAPMQIGGKDIGILAIERFGPDQFSNEDIEIINTFGNQAALAIEGAQLFADQQEEAWVTTALLSVAESVNSTVNAQETLETLVRLAPMFVGVVYCALLEWDAEANAFQGRVAWGTTQTNEAAFTTLSLSLRDEPFTAALLASTEPILAGPEQTDNEKWRGGANYLRVPLPTSLSKHFGLSHMLALPLMAKGALVGGMLVDPPLMHESDSVVAQLEQLNHKRRMKILSGIAHQAALALETDKLQVAANQQQRLARELEVAEGIQRSFLPQKLPQPTGWDLAAYYRAARQVGGDFYDFIPLRDNRIGIVIADVADKGVPAALFMALCRTNIRAAAFSRTDPVETLERVNQLLLSDSRADLFVTVWYGVWDPHTGEMVYANTGHNPPLVVHPDGIASELMAKGIALGVVEKLSLERKRVVLDAGDVLVAYTDGITDALRADGAEFGLVGLQTTVTMSRRRPAKEIVDKVTGAIDTFVDTSDQYDDITLIILRRLGDVPLKEPPRHTSPHGANFDIG